MSCEPLGAIFGRLGSLLGRLGGLLAASWGVLEPFWEHLVVILGHFWTSTGTRKAFQKRFAEIMKNHEKPEEKLGFSRFGGSPIR